MQDQFSDKQFLDFLWAIHSGSEWDFGSETERPVFVREASSPSSWNARRSCDWARPPGLQRPWGSGLGGVGWGGRGEVGWGGVGWGGVGWVRLTPP